MDELNIVQKDQMTAAKPQEIDAIIDQMIAGSKSNIKEMEEYVLECSSALSSVDTRNRALSERGHLKKAWDKLTGKDDRLRNAIVQDQAAAEYAMQKTINCVIRECASNRELAAAIYNHLSDEILNISEYQISVDKDLQQTREALVRFYKGSQQEMDSIHRELEKARHSRYTHCAECGRKIMAEQVLCDHCGSLQEEKLEELPPNIQEKYRKLSSSVKSDCDLGVLWDETAKRYAEKAEKARKIASAELDENEDFYFWKDIGDLIKKCRNEEFQIAVVGVVKAGKSALMNALIGMELAPVGLNSKTAALTKFRSSAGGHYIKVLFYSKSEWNELKKSVLQSGNNKANCGEGEERDDSFFAKLNIPSTKEAERTFVGHEPIIEEYEDIDKFKENIKKWTAADSNEHLFVSEVEVGIDSKYFDLPKQVVFVDTPGLRDAVTYRSEITKKYLGQANAILVAVKPDALGAEAVETIVSVLNHAKNNIDKVLLIGTQRDKLNGMEDYDELILGEDGWASRLAKTGNYYKDKDAASRHIFVTSAYMQLCLHKVLSLSPDELEDDSKISGDEYTNFENMVKKVLATRRYHLEDLRDDVQTQNKIIEAAGIEKLKKRLKSTLIEKQKKLKLQDIRNDYSACRKSLFFRSTDELKRYEKLIKTAEKGTDEIKKQIEEVRAKKDKLSSEKEHYDQMLNELKQFTKNVVAFSEGKKSNIPSHTDEWDYE